MSDFDAIDSLLASVGTEAELPEAEVRRGLREQAGLSKAQVARALGISASTLSAWEAGRDPSGETRAKYGYFLDGLAAKLDTPAPAKTLVPPKPASGGADSVEPDEGVIQLADSEPCVLCGHPAAQRMAGFAQHLDAAECHAAAPAADGAVKSALRQPEPSAPAPQRPAADHHRSATRRVVQLPSESADLIGRSVRAALEAHGGDTEAATAALVKKAIPDAMALLDETRKGGRYDVIAHPWMPDILKKQSARGPDQVWEARPKWTRPELPPGEHKVTILDINGAYLSALKTHLPLGQLEHSTGFDHDRRRAGVHLITPPRWDHDDVLPNPIGQRDEPGALWVTEPTLRLLLRLSGPKYGLCEPPEIHESFTSGATEGLLEKFRIALKDARDAAIATDDEVTLEYVKAMYSKFVSTMGASNYNRELYRPDWMHLIRSQAFANLWMKALKAHDEGLTVVRAMGTDELHVIGDWRKVFPEGRGVAEVKVKDEYAACGANEAGGEA